MDGETGISGTASKHEESHAVLLPCSPLSAARRSRSSKVVPEEPKVLGLGRRSSNKLVRLGAARPLKRTRAKGGYVAENLLYSQKARLCIITFLYRSSFPTVALRFLSSTDFAQSPFRLIRRQIRAYPRNDDRKSKDRSQFVSLPPRCSFSFFQSPSKEVFLLLFTGRLVARVPSR